MERHPCPTAYVIHYDDEYPPLVWVVGHLPYDRDTLREIAKLLINDRRTNVNAETKIGKYTALEKAAYYGEDELVEMLLKRGADPNLHVNEWESVALQNAIMQVGPGVIVVPEEGDIVDIVPRSQKYAKIVKMLLDAGAKVTPHLLELLDKHEKKEINFWLSVRIPTKLREEALEDLRRATNEIRVMLLEKIKNEEKLMHSIREEGEQKGVKEKLSFVEKI